MQVAKMFFFLAALLPLAVAGQSVDVSKETSRIDGHNVPGYQVSFTEPADRVRAALVKYLKTMGRTRLAGDYITLSEPLIAGRKYTAVLYATTRSAGDGCAAWLGLPPGSEDENLDGSLEKLARDFGVTFHRDRIQEQIDESLRALETVEKQQLRLTNQNRDLSHRIENNKKEKIRLEQSLVTNKTELEALQTQLEANGQAQDSVAIAAEQIRKVVEMHRERQRRVK